MAFASSTHDIAADGLYIASLSRKQQAEYAGWQGAFYNVARIFSMGGLIWLAGFLQDHFAAADVADKAGSNAPWLRSRRGHAPRDRSQRYRSGHEVS